MMATNTAENNTGHSVLVSETASTNFLVLMMEGCEESEEETDGFRMVIDLDETIALFREFQSSSFAVLARTQRSGIHLFSGEVPFYTAIHAFLI